MNVFLIVSMLLLSFPSFLQADIKGSNSAVSVEPFFTFPQNPLLGIANEMRGFGWFKNGFALENASTTCLFTSVYPVSGPINLNSGTFTLNQDFIMKNSVDLQGLGTITGNGYTFELCSSVGTLPSTSGTFNNVHVVINNDLVLTSTLIFQGECSIVGNGNTIFLDADGGIEIAANATLLLRDVTIKDISNGNILCVNNSATLVLDTVNWHQNGDYSFSKGKIQFVDHVSFFGNATFTYDSQYTSTITAESTWQICDDMKLSLGCHSSNNTQPLYMEDITSKLWCSNCHIHVTACGITLTRGSIIFDDIVTLDDSSTSTVNGIQIGNGMEAEDPLLKFEVGASVLLQSSHLVFNTGSPYIIKTGAHKAGRLKRFIGSNIYLASDLTFPSMSIEAQSLVIPPIVLANGVTLEFDDTLVVLPNAVFDITSARTDAYTYKLQNGDSISLTKGVFPLNVQIEGSNNSISGNGSISGDITLQDQSASVSIGLQGSVNSVITMNNGTISLSNTMNMGTDAAITGSGFIEMSDKALHLPYIDFDLTCSLLLTGNQSIIGLHSTVSIKSTMTISGNVIINGYGNVLEFGNTGNIYIQDNATLTLKNVYLNNFKDSKIVFLSDSSKIIVDDSQIILGSNCVFDTGSILFHNTVDVSGSYTFRYASSQTSTLDSNAVLHVVDNLKFIVERHAISRAEPLFFADHTSILHLDNAYMNIAGNGAHFSKGTILCDNDVVIDIVGTTTSNGLELGDGSINDTTKVALNASSTIRNVGGVIVYNIGNPNGFVANSRSSQIVRSPLSETYLKTDINMSDLTMRLLDTPQLSIPTPKILNYSNVGIDLPGVEYIITGRRYTNSSNILSGNGLIFITRGTYPLGTVISGINNSIRGNGAIGGPIVFLNASAQLEWALNGSLLGNASLNGGILTLSNNMRLGRGTKINNGTINLKNYSLSYGSKELTITQANYFDGNSGSVELSADIILDATWTFSQNCILNGNGKTITLGNNGNIFVEKGSVLRIKNAKIEGIKNSNIRCLDNHGSLILDDMHWHQSGDFVYELGILEYYNTINMDANEAYVFAYQSCHTSTLHSNSKLKLDSGFTFSYDPIYVASKNLFAFEDQSAVLAMRSATLHTTVTGMQLTKGMIEIKGDCQFSSEIEDIDIFTQINEGISLGNRIESDDMYVEISGGSQLRVTAGSLLYKNVNQYSWYMFNPLSKVRVENGASLRLYENLILGIGYLELQMGAGLIKAADDKEVVGSIFLVE